MSQESRFYPTDNMLLRQKYEGKGGGACVKPDTLMLGSNKAISDLVIGDDVLGLSGITKVVEVFSRPYRGEMIEITAVGALPIEVTPEHPILIASGETKWIKRSENLKNGSNRITLYEPKWIFAKDVVAKHKNHDYAVTPIPSGHITTHELDLSLYLRPGYRGKPISKIPLNAQVARLLGLYVAEGFVISWTPKSEKRGKEAVCFAFGKHETGLHNEIIATANSLGYRGRTEVVPTGVRVIISSRLLARALPNWCGRGAINKRIPDFILYNLDKEVLREFLVGYLSGDGGYYKGTAYAKTISRLLALQLQIAGLRLGLNPIIRRMPRREKPKILGRAVNTHDSYLITFLSRTKWIKIDKNLVFRPIRSIKRNRYDGTVHNITTLDNTYLASNILVHNCGPAAIAALERKQVQEILDGWRGVGESAFRGFSPIGDMIETLQKLGYNVVKRRGFRSSVFPIPATDKAIVRIQWLQENGEEYFWRAAGAHTHYIAMEKFIDGWWAFCNMDLWFPAHEQEGINYLNARLVQGYVSSYLELTKNTKI